MPEVNITITRTVTVKEIEFQEFFSDETFIERFPFL